MVRRTSLLDTTQPRAQVSFLEAWGFRGHRVIDGSFWDGWGPGAKRVAQSCLCRSFSSFPFGSCVSCAELFWSAFRDFAAWDSMR